MRHRGISLVFVVGMLLSLFAGPEEARSKDKRKIRRLAIVVGGMSTRDPQLAQAVRNDVELWQATLRAQGYAPSEVVVLSGAIGPRLFLASLEDVARRIARWRKGQVLLCYSGSGSQEHPKEKGAPQHVGVALRGGAVRWSQIFATLKVPDGVNLLLLPDC